MRVHVPDPGYEQRETLATALHCGGQSGLGGLLLTPDTEPVADQKSLLAYWREEAEGHPVRILPMAALSKGLQGKELAELFDLHRSGAVMFGDANRPLDRPGLLLKAMMYTQLFDGLVNLSPAEGDLPEGQMHEGAVNVRLGLTGNPSLRETMAVERVLALLDYAGGKIHFSLISSREGVALIRDARKKGLQVTADTSAHHLCFCDEDLADYPTHLKFQPPLRGRSDREALVQAVREGVIDGVVSDHYPLEPEAKQCEFNLAQPGAIGMQTLFSQTLEALGDMDASIRALADAPRRILQLPSDHIQEGQPVQATLFDPESTWKLQEATNLSRSSNSPYMHRSLKGKALALFSGDQMVVNRSF